MVNFALFYYSGAIKNYTVERAIKILENRNSYEVNLKDLSTVVIYGFERLRMWDENKKKFVVIQRFYRIERKIANFTEMNTFERSNHNLNFRSTENIK